MSSATIEKPVESPCRPPKSNGALNPVIAKADRSVLLHTDAVSNAKKSNEIQNEAPNFRRPFYPGTESDRNSGCLRNSRSARL